MAQKEVRIKKRDRKKQRDNDFKKFRDLRTLKF